MVVDYGTEFARWARDDAVGQPVTFAGMRATAAQRLLQRPPAAGGSSAMELCAKLAHTCTNKSKRAVFCVTWTPDGRRLLAGSMNGEFSLYHGMNFGPEMVMQAHESAVRCMAYSPAGDWLLSGDHEGTLKVWQPNFNNVKMQKCHSEVLRGVAWSPQNSKFATVSDDCSVKVWSFASMAEEHVWRGPQAHGWDVKCVDWHSSYSLLSSGSKDNTLRLWDPRQQRALATLHAFKNTVSQCKFQPTGSQNLLAASSRDHTAHVFDLRMLGSNAESSAVAVLRGHPSDVACVAWHPTHSNLLSTGTHTGSLHHFVLDSAANTNDVGHLMPALSLPHAHQWPVWDLAYHPVGHILASGSNDKTVRVWKRADLGDSKEDIEHKGYEELQAQTIQVKKRTGIPGLRPREPAEAEEGTEEGAEVEEELVS